MVHRVLFLGYDETKSSLPREIRQRGYELIQTGEKITSTEGYDLAISYGYRHILRGEALRNCPIVNLHIAYLPFNRGAHPNFWAHYEGTPSGVTIHLIDEGIDTGPILYQKLVTFSPEEDTLEKTYLRLNREMESLFIQNMGDILSLRFVPRRQHGIGTFHRMKDLPPDFPGWNSRISDVVILGESRRTASKSPAG